MSDVSAALVSLVMPVWNPNASWLTEAVASALGQRGCNVELVVVDNGNEASVGELLARLQDPRIRIVRVEHGGVSCARNAGMSVARGQFVRFVDCDDVLDLDSTSRLLALGDPATIAYGATEYCDESLRPYKTVTCTMNGTIGERALTDFTVMLPTILFPRRVLELAGSWDETLTICEDWDFVLRALEHAPVRGETKVALRYRRHGTSAVGRASIDLAERSAERVVAKYVARHPEQRDSPSVRRAHAIRLTDAGSRYLNAGQRREAASRFVRSLRVDFPYAAGSIASIVARRIVASTRS
jgi:glycosyltransferase involved in cell wall biosynthesis